MNYELCSEKDVIKAVKIRNPFSHKGENGCVLVIGGSENYVSAPALSALAALRTGIDLIQVAAPEKAAYAINSFSIDFITRKFHGDFLAEKHLRELLPFAETFDSVLIGPGLGKHSETRKFVNKFVSKFPAEKLVIDADALQMLEKKNIKGLLTPHHREFEILFGEYPSKNLDERVTLVKKFAKEFNSTILLKGRIDVVSDGHKVKVNKTGNAGMTVGGSGDVLAGICTGFKAQGADNFTSACAGVFANCKIGDKLLPEKGYGLVSSDLIAGIPEAIFGIPIIKNAIKNREQNSWKELKND
ncbi:MAG: NAD(P)H-hydrate dehydratase [Candidatus Diapherotrites archaeon]|nr:NAD(P)H-hydrate dehydratase [Candidatus Diapherotrites archaeon]